MERTDLKDIAGISSSSLAVLGKDAYVLLESIEKSCALGCSIDQVVDVIGHTQGEGSNGKY